MGVAELGRCGPDGTFGNRYDDPEASYRVLYASSQRIGAFLETLARFTPDLEVLAEVEQVDGDDEPSSGLPRAWLNERMIGEATLQGRFVGRNRRSNDPAPRAAGVHAARVTVRLRAARGPGLVRRYPLPLAARRRNRHAPSPFSCEDVLADPSG